MRSGVLGLVLLAVTVAGGACGSGDGWHSVAVSRAGFAHDRSVVWAQTTEYHSYSCNDVRLDLDRGHNSWRVGVSVRKTADMCTMEAEIGDPPASATGVVVASGADGKRGGGHNLVEVELPEPAPEGVTLRID